MLRHHQSFLLRALIGMVLIGFLAAPAMPATA
jgi:hypothetical protein